MNDKLSHRRRIKKKVRHHAKKSEPATELPDLSSLFGDTFRIKTKRKHGRGVVCIFHSVIIKYSSILCKFNGGYEQFKKRWANCKFQTDGELVGFIAMDSSGLSDITDDLEKNGLKCRGKNVDFYLLDVGIIRGGHQILTQDDGQLYVQEVVGDSHKVLVSLKKGIPEGLYKCPKCGEYRGKVKVKDLHWGFLGAPREKYTTASCLCEGILCGRCKKNLIHKPGSNQYDPEANEVWHWPGMCAMMPCSKCRAKEKVRNIKS
jgi:hypothetical protein